VGDVGVGAVGVAAAVLLLGLLQEQVTDKMKNAKNDNLIKKRQRKPVKNKNLM